MISYVGSFTDNVKVLFARVAQGYICSVTCLSHFLVPFWLHFLLQIIYICMIYYHSNNYCMIYCQVN